MSKHEKVPLLDFLRQSNIATKPTLQDRLLLFELGDLSETATYFFQLLKHFFQKHWEVIFENSIINCEPSFFDTKIKALWISKLASEEEVLSSKNSLQDILKSSIPKNAVFIIKKLSTKDSSLLLDLGFKIIIFDQKKFRLRDFYQIINKLLCSEISESKTNIILDTFGHIYFSELDLLIAFLSSLSVTSINSFELFKKNYAPSFFKDSFFKLTQLLFGATQNPAKFFALWQNIKSDFPIQFWTSFFMNKTWSVLISSEQNNKILYKKQKLLYIDLYLADLYSKQIGCSIFLEPVFYAFFTN